MSTTDSASAIAGVTTVDFQTSQIIRQRRTTKKIVTYILLTLTGLMFGHASRCAARQAPAGHPPRESLLKRRAGRLRWIPLGPHAPFRML